MRRLYLIRHGRVDFASRDFREGPRGRQWDPPLGEHGREQAELFAARLSHMDPPAALYASPFRRCVETTEPVARRLGLDAAYDEDLGEVFLGEWEGESFEEIIANDEELARRFRKQEPMGFHLAPGGESGDAIRERVGAAVEGILARHPEGDVLVIAHGGVINAYVTPLLGVEAQDMLFVPENTSVNTIEVDGDARRVRFLNDTRHLASPRMFGVSEDAG